MDRAKRSVLVAGMLLLSVNAVHAGLWSRKKQTPAAPPAAAASAIALSSVEIDGSRVLLRTSGTPAYTSYSPAPDVFIVDLTGTARDASLAIPTTLPPAVSSIAAEEVTEMGTRLTRVTFRLSQPLTLEAAGADKSVVVTVPATAIAIQEQPAPEIAPVVTVTPEPQREQVAEVQPIAEPLVVEQQPAAPVPVALPKAKTVKKIEASVDSGSPEVWISADGAMTYKSFRLNSPERLVIDIEAKHAVAKNAVAVNDDVVKKVRVAQFSPAIARVVIDLAQKTDYHIENQGDQLRVAFGRGAIASKLAEPAAAPAATITVVEPPPAPRKTEPKPAPVKTAAATDIPSQVPTVAANASTWKVPEPASKGARSVITSADQAVPPLQTPPRQEDVFAEAAPQQPITTPAAGQTLGQRTLSEQRQRVYNGEPISLNLKDADIKDVLRTFAELTGLNIAVDPGVTGSVTVDFVEVPWDQALDIILRQNQLTYVLEGNVMRIGTIARISSEARASRALDEEERLNVPMTTLSFKLSYARAPEVSALLKEIASPRARVIVDERTNQLIISEIPQYMALMQNLITTVDIPNRQVVIEARIVESSRTFSHAFGFSWGFEGVLDPALGTGTGLIFPNRVGFTGGPFSFTGGARPVLGFTLSDVLGTFSLDFALHAAEAQGYVRVVSAPRVTTQDNTPAEIQSGFQIPYQTRINFTTTINYLDATLRLTVRPQITEAGTVIMDIQVQKDEPAIGLAIEGAAGTPLTTRRARTRLMVRDGGTAVIAGIFQTKDNSSDSRVPFVSQIPVIGSLFRAKNIVTSHDELLIFITPKIVRS